MLFALCRFTDCRRSVALQLLHFRQPLESRRVAVDLRLITTTAAAAMRVVHLDLRNQLKGGVMAMIVIIKIFMGQLAK